MLILMLTILAFVAWTWFELAHNPHVRFAVRATGHAWRMAYANTRADARYRALERRVRRTAAWTWPDDAAADDGPYCATCGGYVHRGDCPAFKW